jgi:prevent-host-death family protein
MRVTIADAKKSLPKLIKAVEHGEAVTICRRSVPVVDLVPSEKAKPRRRRIILGSLRGQIQILDPDRWKPMSDDEVEDFLNGY